MKLLKGGLPALMVLALMVALVVPAAAAATSPEPPPPLTTEKLNAGSGGGGGIQCGNTGGSFSFKTSGTATGPYPGTFTETVSGTINSDQELSSFTATFTINSTNGTVTGTKELTGPIGQTACYQDSRNFVVLGANTTYQAKIETSQSTYYTDQGDAYTEVGLISGRPYVLEDFTSSQGSPTLIEPPTSVSECKKGGHEEFGHRNQGRCIRVVNQGRR